jgi:hypothetical protein
MAPSRQEWLHFFTVDVARGCVDMGNDARRFAHAIDKIYRKWSVRRSEGLSIPARAHTYQMIDKI